MLVLHFLGVFPSDRIPKATEDVNEYYLFAEKFL